jgi:hypothetical protein
MIIRMSEVLFKTFKFQMLKFRNFLFIFYGQEHTERNTGSIISLCAYLTRNTVNKDKPHTALLQHWQIEYNLFPDNDGKCKGHSEMVWTQPMCSNFITFRLNMKQLLAQHIPVQSYTSLPPPRKLLDGFTEPLFTGVATPHPQPPVQSPCPCWSSILSWTQCCMQALFVHMLQVVDNEYLTV